MAGLIKGVLGLIGLGGGQSETARQALQLHDGQVTVSIDSDQMLVTMQIDERHHSQPIIFDLLNNTILNVTTVPPGNNNAPGDVPVL
jgi:hypothetical protein